MRFNSASITAWLSAALAFALITACSGGGSSDQPVPEARAYVPTEGGSFSPGCALGDASSVRGSDGMQTMELSANGTSWTVAFMVPTLYDPTVPSPLMFEFHGAGGNGGDIFDLPDAARARGQPAILISPTAHEKPQYGPGTDWDTAQGSEDFVLFDAMWEWAQNNLCIDNQRVYAAGFSSGGEMAHALACYRNVFRAVQTYSAPLPTALSTDECGYPRPAYRATYSPDDTDFPDYTEAVLEATTEYYRSSQSCGTSTSQLGPASCQTYSGCEREVTYCPIKGLLHHIPSDSGPTTWAFFERNY